MNGKKLKKQRKNKIKLRGYEKNTKQTKQNKQKKHSLIRR